MKPLVEGDCGRSNALVGLARDYGNSNQRIAPSTSRGASSLLPSSSRGEQFANDFLQSKAKQAVGPASFNMNALSAQLPKPSSSSSLASTWSNEFQVRPQNPMASQWASQYTAARPAPMESAWAMVSGQKHFPVNTQSSSIDSGMWSAEFLDTFDTSMQKADDYSSQLADNWATEFGEQMPDVWRHMNNEWDAIQKNVEMAQGDTISVGHEEKYVHQENNPFLTSADPISEGDHLMDVGDLGSAMLAYEAAVQKNPGDANAWCKLGLSHAENEHDSKAIAAFKRCLEIEPSNQEALLSLSVSLANESRENDALLQLDRWISVHQGQSAQDITMPASSYTSFLDHGNFKRVEDKFLAAAHQQNGTADAALQNALGVLYNLNRNFERAVDCIKLAIASQPQDPRLWNRLGATLANGDRTADAIGAYREALSRYPTYVRARYNLGISCMHLTSHREAIEHFISALELQKGAEGHSIWPTLRSASIRLRGCSKDLLQALDNRDLPGFKAAFARIPPN